MGGRIPYGYRLTSTVINNVRTSMYEEVPKKSEQLKLTLTCISSFKVKVHTSIILLVILRATMPAIFTRVLFPAQKNSTIYSTKKSSLHRTKTSFPSKICLICRIRCLNSRQSIKTCKPKNSWLVGKIKCGNCGYVLKIRKAKTKRGRYFISSQSGNRGNCNGADCTIYADVSEEYTLNVIKKRLSEFQNLSCNIEITWKI